MEITNQQDHSYINGAFDQINPAEFTYKMSRKEIEEFVKLRIANNYLFSGRKNTSKWGWRAILKHMGLHFKMNHRQAAKKWDHMKKKYRLIKYPPDGVKVVSDGWAHFSLMDDAMEGRLDGMAPVLESLNNSKDSDFLPYPRPKKKKVSNAPISPVTNWITSEPEIEVSLNGMEDVDAVDDVEDVTVLEKCEEIQNVLPNVVAAKDSEPKTNQMEQQLLQKERETLEREIASLDRERTLLERERAVIERERVTMERERAVMERERAVMEREKSAIEKDRDALHRERLALDKEKSRWERVSAQNEKTTEDNGEMMDSDAVNKKERVKFLFEKLIENM